MSRLMKRRLSSALRIAVLGVMIATAGPSHAQAHPVPELGFRVVDLGALPGDTSSNAINVNDFGHVVGISSDNATNHAVLWVAGGVRDLGTLPAPYDADARAQAVNDRDEVVGSSESIRSGPRG